MSVRVQKRLYSASELYEINSRSEQQYELMNGELVAVAPVSDVHGKFAVRICTAIENFNVQKDLGEVRVETGYNLNSSTTRGPDVSFYSNSRNPLTDEQKQSGYLDFPPDLAVEIVSPGDRPGDILKKVQEYLEAGVRLVWVVYPKKEIVNVIRPDEPILMLSRKNNDKLEGYDILPDFELSLENLFATKGSRSGQEV